MEKELGIARCGLACCLCSENEHCGGCDSGNCPDTEWCENRKCSKEKNIDNCFLCEEDCRKGLLAKIKPYGFTLFAKRYGIETLLNCLEENEKNGIVYAMVFGAHLLPYSWLYKSLNYRIFSIAIPIVSLIVGCIYSTFSVAVTMLIIEVIFVIALFVEVHKLNVFRQ